MAADGRVLPFGLVRLGPLHAHLVASLRRAGPEGGDQQTDASPEPGHDQRRHDCSRRAAYCDAIWVDNEVAGLLREEPLRTRIDYGTRVFSRNTRQQFLDYVNELQATIPDEHVDLVRDVYGEGYLRPFTEVFAAQDE